MICKQYFVTDDRWTGYCVKVKDTVKGDFYCKWHPQMEMDFKDNQFKSNDDGQRID